MTELILGDIHIEVEQKDIQNVHLSVYPPDGRVRIAAPTKYDADTIRAFVVSKLSWIKKQRAEFQSQERETPREYLPSESHYLWGDRYLLEIEEHNGPAFIELEPGRLVMHVRPGTSVEKRHQFLQEWYRKLLKEEAARLIPKWEKKIGVKITEFGIKKMRTKWGTCNPSAQRIWLNLELARKPKICLEYIIVHELVHLLEPTHNKHFLAHMDRLMPAWPHHRDTLNRLPFRHLEWGY